MSKINSFALVLLIAVSLSSCTDKSNNLVNTWRIESVKPSKPNPQMEAFIGQQVEMMKGYQHITYKADGTSEEVQGPRTVKGTWDVAKEGKVIYATNESGRTERYSVVELTKDKFTYSMATGPTDTLIFTWVPFSAKDTLNRKPLPSMQPRAQQGPPPAEQEPADEKADNKDAKPAGK